MPELRIVNVPQALIYKIDALQTESGYHDRSTFLIAALQDYCLYHDDYFMHCLPDTIRILSEDIIKSNGKKTQDLLEHMFKTTDRCGDTMKQLLDFFEDVAKEDDPSEDSGDDVF